MPRKRSKVTAPATKCTQEDTAAPTKRARRVASSAASGSPQLQEGSAAVTLPLALLEELVLKVSDEVARQLSPQSPAPRLLMLSAKALVLSCLRLLGKMTLLRCLSKETLPKELSNQLYKELCVNCRTSCQVISQLPYYRKLTLVLINVLEINAT